MCMMWSLLGILCVAGVVIALPLSKDTAELPLVTIAQGTVTGLVAADGEYFEFYGIPYADSTAGSHRFKAPLPPPVFTETFVANRNDIKCVRPLGVGFEGTEDCLVADVFTPTLDKESKLPVMVWVKGRKFEDHETELSFKNFVSQDIIVVSLNFRESILGYLCLGTETAPGNAGLKDIIAGLRWVKENIEQFGGDPDTITLIGHGSGAAAVDLITLSPLADGLVHRAIAQSGNALAPWAVSRDNSKYAMKVAEALGHAISDIQDLSEFFTRVSVPALMGVINELDLTDNSFAFSPCVENENLADAEPFLVNTPFKIISEGEFLQIPLLTGFVDNEGTIKASEISDSDWLRRMDESFAEFIQADLAFENDIERAEVIEKIKALYFQYRPITQNEAIAYHGDTMILVSTIREAWLRSSQSTAPIYLYQFSYKGSLGEPFVGPIEVGSAAHSEELAYLFYEVPLISETEEIPEMDLNMRDILIERWTNFAKTGNPTSDTSGLVWQPFNNEAPHYIRFVGADEAEEGARNLESELQDPHRELKAFWDEIYEEHFLDAQSNWNLQIKDDDNDDNLIEEPATASPDEEDPVDEITTQSPDEDDTTTTPLPDSASTAVGYTFMIIAMFALIDKFHSSQLLS